jgi:hypothetical protein
VQAVRVCQVGLQYTSQLTRACWLQLYLDSYEAAHQVLPPTSVRLQQRPALWHDTSTSIIPVPNPRIVAVFRIRADSHPFQLPQQLELSPELLILGHREQAVVRQGQETAEGLRELVRVRSTPTPPLLLNCTHLTNHHHLPRTLRSITYTHPQIFYSGFYHRVASTRYTSLYFVSPTRLGHERTTLYTLRHLLYKSITFGAQHY